MSKSRYNPLNATRASDYSGLRAWAQPQENPMFSQGQGYIPYVPPAAPASFGMDWGSGMPTGSASDAMVASFGKAGQGDWMSSLKNMGQSVKDFLPSGFLSSTDANGLKTDGWGGVALGTAKGLFDGFNAMKMYGLQKDILNTNKQQFERNFAAQKGVTNSQLADRQDRRNKDAAFNGRSDMTSTADYMKKYGVA